MCIRDRVVSTEAVTGVRVMTAKARRRPSASTTVPARVLTPLRVPVLARISPAASAAPDPEPYRLPRVPVNPATGRPVSTGRRAGCCSEAARESSRTRTAGGIALRGFRPLPSLRTTSAIGTPSLVSSWVTAAAAPSKPAGWWAARAA